MMEPTRRRFIAALGALGASAWASGCAVTSESSQASIERNKTIALRLKQSQTEKGAEATRLELLAPDYRQTRSGMMHLGANAEGQGFPSPGANLRTAFPDRVDVIEEVVAEGDTVGMLWKLTGTHRGNLYGIAPTGRRVEVFEAAILRIVNGRVREGWFMADEAGLLKQLGASLPPRSDGRRIVPPVTNAGQDPDAVLRKLSAAPLVTKEDRQKLVVAQSKGSGPPPGVRANDYRQTRQGFQHLRDYGVTHGVAKETPSLALPDRRDLIDGFIAEGDSVWMRFKIAGTQKGRLYGHPATGRRVEIPEIGIARFENGKWREGWYFGDELGLMLQLDALHMLG